MTPKYDEATAQRIVQLRRQGRSVSQLAAEFAVSRATIRDWMERIELGPDPGWSDRGALISPVDWLRAPPVRIRLQRYAAGI
ncbi:MAG: Transposase [Pseudomonadota bacterium]|jgi:transposase